MNKMLTKLTTTFIGMAMAIGVGVAVASNSKEATPVQAAGSSDWAQVTALSGLNTSDTYVITNDADKGYYMNGTVSSGHFQSTAFSASAPASATAAGTFKLEAIDASNNIYKIKLVSTSKYVYASKAASGGGKVDGSSDSAGWKFLLSGTSFNAIYQTAYSGKYAAMRCYSDTSWRTYSNNSATSISTTSGTVFRLYKYQPKTLSSIAVSGATTSFTVGDTFSFGGTVTATYSDSTTANVTSSTTFSGYNMSVEGEQTVTASYTEGGVTKTTTYGITVSSSSVQKYTVEFDSNGGSEDPASKQVEEDGTFTFPSPGTKSHHSFLGWSSDGGTTKYATDTTSPAVTADITYTAYWQEDAKYTVTYVKGEHGTGDNYVVSNQYAGSYTLATFATAGFTADNGYAFRKWDVGGVEYAEGAEITISGNTTVTALYDEVTVYTLVTDPTKLTDGTTFVLVGYSASTYRICKGLNSGHVKMNIVTSATTISNGVSSGSTLITEEADVYTLKGSAGSWEILDSSGKYLQFTGTSNGKDSFGNSSSDNSKFTISGDETIDIRSNAQSNRYWRYNTGTGDLRNGDSTYGNDIYMFANIAASTDTTTNLAISSCSDTHYNSTTNTWTGYDAYTLDISSFTISCTTTKSTATDGYAFKGIGYMNGEQFVARKADFSSGNPTTADTRLCWEAKYPTAVGGSTYLKLYVILSVTADYVQSLAITGSMSKTTYVQNEPWDPDGFTVNAYYASAPSTPVDVTDEDGLTWSYSPATTASLTTTSVVCTASFGGETAESSAQTVTVGGAVTSIVFGAASGQWKPTASGSTYVDSNGNTATLTTDTSYFGSSKPIQIGKNNSGGVTYAATYVDIVIPLSEKAGIDSISATFRSNGSSTSVYLYVYGDTDNDLILSGSVTGNSASETISTGGTYEKINASRLKYRFEIGGTGVMLDQLTYQLGTTVADFGTMVDLDILTPASNNQFKEGDVFSGAGIVLLATDDSVPAITKNITTGLKFGTAQGNDYFTGHEFDAEDAATGSFTVYVTATIGDVTMSVTYTITVTEVPNYSLVTDYSDLYEGAKVIIVAGEKAFGTFETTSATAVSPDFEDGVVTDAKGATEFTVRIYGDKFGLQFGTYFLALNGDNNQVHRNLELNDAGAWSKDDTGILSPVASRHLICDGTKFICQSSGTQSELYISNKSPKTDALSAETFAQKYLHMRDYTTGNDSCKNDSSNHYYSTAKNYYTSTLTAEEKIEFAKLSDAVARFQAWARANGETFDPSEKTFTKNANIVVLESANIANNGENILLVIATLTLVAFAFGGYTYFRKKKQF